MNGMMDKGQGLYSRANLAMMRVKKDMQELATQRLSCSCGSASTAIEFPDGNKNLLKIKVTVSITAGCYRGGTYVFMLDIPPAYPFRAPEVTCTARIWHPNIDTGNGRVELDILNKDWRPVFSINTVVFALQLLFLEPNPGNAINIAAAHTLRTDPALFENQVQQTLHGGVFSGLAFERNIGLANAEGSPPMPHIAMKRKSYSDDDGAAELVEETESMCIQDAVASHGGGGGEIVEQSSSKRICWASDCAEPYQAPSPLPAGHVAAFPSGIERI